MSFKQAMKHRFLGYLNSAELYSELFVMTQELIDLLTNSSEDVGDSDMARLFDTVQNLILYFPLHGTIAFKGRNYEHFPFPDSEAEPAIQTTFRLEYLLYDLRVVDIADGTATPRITPYLQALDTYINHLQRTHTTYLNMLNAVRGSSGIMQDSMQVLSSDDHFHAFLNYHYHTALRLEHGLKQSTKLLQKHIQDTNVLRDLLFVLSALPSKCQSDIPRRVMAIIEHYEPRWAEKETWDKTVKKLEAGTITLDTGIRYQRAKGGYFTPWERTGDEPALYHDELEFLLAKIMQRSPIDHAISIDVREQTNPNVVREYCDHLLAAYDVCADMGIGKGQDAVTANSKRIAQFRQKLEKGKFTPDNTLRGFPNRPYRSAHLLSSYLTLVSNLAALRSNYQPASMQAVRL